MKNAFLNVDQHIARNPVARAVAKQRLTSAIRDFQLRIHTMQEGDDIDGDIDAAIQVLTVCMFAMSRTGEGEHPSIEVMSNAHKVLVACADRGCQWRPEDAMPVDVGLQHAAELYPQLPSEAITWAWGQMRAIDKRIAEKLATEKQVTQAEPEIHSPQGEHA